jgi:hypothetical protein
MSKNKDLIQILIIVTIGMAIPFFLSLISSYNIDLSNLQNIIKIFLTFLLFLIIFAIELIIVYVYFFITNLLANKKINNQKN